MAYMIYQRYSSAVKEAYDGRHDIAQQYETARTARMWLQELEIDEQIRHVLVEQLEAIEEGFRELLVRSGSQT